MCHHIKFNSGPWIHFISLFIAARIFIGFIDLDLFSDNDFCLVSSLVLFTLANICKLDFIFLTLVLIFHLDCWTWMPWSILKFLSLVLGYLWS